MSSINTFPGGTDKKVRVNAIDPPKELHITGTGVTVTDNPGAGRYDIVITGGSANATPLAKSTATKSGNSSTKVFTIAHGMLTTPVFASVVPTSVDALGSFVTSWDATNITLTYSVPPPSNSNNLTYAWMAMDISGGGGSANASETKGVTAFSGNGSNNTFTIPHTLASTPSAVLVKCSSLPDGFTYTYNATNIIVTFPFPPPSGSGNVIFQWLAKA